LNDEWAVLQIPSAMGTYALALELPVRTEVSVGKLGSFLLEPGPYIYFGSARGSGGLRARIARHLRINKALRWHVDYLRPFCTPIAIWYAVSDERLECAWAQAALHLPGTQAPVRGFGSSDCRCATHLVYVFGDPAEMRKRTFSPHVQHISLRGSGRP
jgi:Uri superfamily endonuclease